MRKNDHQDDCQVAATYDVRYGLVLTMPDLVMSHDKLNTSAVIVSLFSLSHYLITTLLFL